MDLRGLLFAIATAALLITSASARVGRVEILSRADVLEGKAFGEAGVYEKLSGKVHFAVKPETAPNKFIVDLEKAPRNEAGEVEFSADFYVLRPKEAARSSGSVLLEIPNRGGKGILAVMQGGKGSRDPTTEEEFGDGFLMRRGVTVAWLGWQWDAREEANTLRLYSPRARELEGVSASEKKGKTSNAESSPREAVRDGRSPSGGAAGAATQRRTSNGARGKRRDMAEAGVAGERGDARSNVEGRQGAETSNAQRSTSNLQIRGANPASDAEINRALSPRSTANPPSQQSGAAGVKAITGLVRADFTVNERQEEHPLGHMISGNIGGTEYAAADPEHAANVLTVRDAPMAARQIVPRSEWQFVPGGEAKGEAARELRAIRLKGGFEPGKIYEVVYRAQEPAIAGLGFAAVRDFAAYLKREGNELEPATQRVHALGISQSGRFLRHFLLEGFNADEAGQRAIDGMFIHVAGAGIGSFNHRFAQPSRDAQPTTALFYPTDLFPFTDAPQAEPETGNEAGLLDRLRIRSGGDPRLRTRHTTLLPSTTLLPKIFHTNTSYEYWSRAGSLIHTSPDGKGDVPPLENARIYHLAGLQHFSRAFPPTPETEPSLAAQHLSNPNPVRWFWRALFVAMDDWVREGKEPPESRYPKIADGTLVRPSRHSERSEAESKNPDAGRKGKATGSLDFARDDQVLQFPRIPGVEPPERVHDALRLDLGPQWKNRIITKQPPGVGKPFPALVPQVDEDGNDLGGVRLPQLEVPLATYTGWNLRDPKIGMPNERISFLGSFFPLPKTKADADAAGDPRRAIAERYPSREEYLTMFREAANRLADGRFLLKEDVEAIAQRGGEEWDYVNQAQ
ncbi:MAG: hypothetical protein AVDCRST_MAG42-165 [uncultured Chthoniobacterales bacterium]|uniref:Alpha/beta hydrolase domain-containing protein n=1 Tax=uncultured Chthoniobacterales bacterium TaxID=1836801 RepID=A0A6J4H7N2_9BACT|nr:MAG: hypothetical protein AVDCRST_MAG42-165 [uncultured Chthoniobacterales bacterium]